MAGLLDNRFICRYGMEYFWTQKRILETEDFGGVSRLKKKKKETVLFYSLLPIRKVLL